MGEYLLDYSNILERKKWICEAIGTNLAQLRIIVVAGHEAIEITVCKI